MEIGILSQVKLKCFKVYLFNVKNSDSYRCFNWYQVGCMTRSPVEFKDITMIGGILQILNIHYGSPINEYVLLWCMMVSITVLYF